MVINIEELEIAAGDELRIKYGINSATYIIYPPVKNLETLLYVTEWETLDLIQIAGNLRTESTIEHVVSQSTVATESKIRKHLSKDEQTLTLNTGLLFAQNSKTLHAIVKSRVAFLLHKDASLVNVEMERTEGLIYTELIPITTKITNSDKLKQLYSYDLEFKINKNNDNEVYTF